jgi:hypothetical protein
LSFTTMEGVRTVPSASAARNFIVTHSIAA